MKLLLLILALTWQSQPLSNSDIVQMTQAGLSPDTIVAKIKASKTSFDTSPATLSDLKAKGVAESVLTAMIGEPVVTANPPKSDAQERVIRAMRKLANSVEIGVNLRDYGALIAETKTELESFLPDVGDTPLRQSLARAFSEYQFAAEVWGAHWNTDYIEGGYREVAVKSYGVEKRGLLKVIWRDEFLRAIWREARRHYEAALYPRKSGSQAALPTTTLQGVWTLSLAFQSDEPQKWELRVFSGARVLGYLSRANESKPLQRLSLSGNKFHIETKDPKWPILDGIMDGNQLRGTATLADSKSARVFDLIGIRQP